MQPACRPDQLVQLKCAPRVADLLATVPEV